MYSTRKMFKDLTGISTGTSFRHARRQGIGTGRRKMRYGTNTVGFSVVKHSTGQSLHLNRRSLIILIRFLP